jgi:hypothetical protein
LEATTIAAIARIPGRYLEFMCFFRFYKVVGDLAVAGRPAPYALVRGYASTSASAFATRGMVAGASPATFIRPSPTT